MSIIFDSRNPRIKIAKRKKALNHTPIFVLNYCIAILFLISGITLLLLQESIGWILIGFITWPLIFNFWIKNALTNIPVRNTQNFTDLISEDLLLLLKRDLTPIELAKILPKTSGGMFIMARFNLTIQLFEILSPYFPAAVEPIYQNALDLRIKTNSPEINGAILTVAFIQSISNYPQILNQLKLSVDDLYRGINWYNQLNSIVEDSKKPIHSGGIARDLAFGYTPTLQRFAINLSERYTKVKHISNLIENSEVINRMIHIFSHRGRQNVSLIGAYGSGRSAIVNSFAQILMNADSKIPNNLKYRQIYSLDAPSIISTVSNNNELEYLMISIFNEIYSAKNIILCLNNAHLFFEEGPGSIDISNLLVPILEAGKVRIILIMDDQKFLEISTKNPTLTNTLNKININPTNYEETIKILMAQIPYIENQKNVLYTYKAIDVAYHLSNQYIHDIAMPGKARLLLESAANYAKDGIVTESTIERTIEKTYGVKIQVANSVEDREKLLNLEQLIHERMIDQAEAVSAISNALRRAGAGVRNQNRPIGTFLFLGPTGVGKTELAKTLSEVYFGGEDHIIRLDMNEFVSTNDVARLIHDGATDALSLTAQVAKQPYSVVLLDEIEKAHPSVITTLLQVLDEGILRDEKNHEVNFRNCIIIATSNAGANKIHQKITAGVDIDDFKDEFIDEIIKNNEFKPEFLNRFDEICLFKPLSKTDLLQILDLIIASINKTLESQKISINVSLEAKQILVKKGYDPKMGARPMRRIVQKTVENIIAAAILSGAATPGSVLTITPSEISINQN